MGYVRLKKELNWSLRNEGIVVYDGNRNLQFAINTNNNTEVFKFLSFLAEGCYESEIDRYSSLTADEKQSILDYLLQKDFAQVFDNPVLLTRTDTFINTFPNTTFLPFKNYSQSTRIIIIGLGTVGSHAFDLLIRLGFTNFIIIDGDTVEPKNLTAQSYYTTDIGRSKVEVIKERYRQMAQIEVYRGEIKTLSQLYHVTGGIENEDILINAADDYQLMKQLAQAVVNGEILCTLIESGYGPLIQTAYLIHNQKTAKLFLDYIHQQTITPVATISENSGSILNGYLSAFMIGQLLLSSFVGKRHQAVSYHFYDDNLVWQEV